jgi:clathrin heavy chain
LHIIEVSTPAQGNQPFSKKQVEIQFAAESNADFPISMQVYFLTINTHFEFV